MRSSENWRLVGHSGSQSLVSNHVTDSQDVREGDSSIETIKSPNSLPNVSGQCVSGCWEGGMAVSKRKSMHLVLSSLLLPQGRPIQILVWDSHFATLPKLPDRSNCQVLMCTHQRITMMEHFGIESKSGDNKYNNCQGPCFLFHPPLTLPNTPSAT